MELSSLIDKLVAASVNMSEPTATPRTSVAAADTSPAGTEPDQDAAALPLSGMSVVVTGAMSGKLEALSRNEMNELIERAGGKASSSVSAKTSLVVAGEKAGSKRAKSEALGVRVTTPQEFAELVDAYL